MNGNILEKDIEEAIYDGQLLMKYGIKIVGRQVSTVKSKAGSSVAYDHYMGGIIDLIGYHLKSRTWIIIEIKRGVIDAAAFTQLSRYMSAARDLAQNYTESRPRRPRVAGLLIGSDWSRDLDFIDELNDWDEWGGAGSVKNSKGYVFNSQRVTKLMFSAKTTLEVTL